MRWSYKTVHFSLKKEGLLGSAFIDENEIEVSLNEYGKLGWELVSFMEVNDGLIAVFKQPFAQGLAVIDKETVMGEEEYEEYEGHEIEDEILGGLPPSMAEPMVNIDAPRETTPTQGLSEVPDTEKGDNDTSGADVGSIRIL